jgi:hypothetical protein
MKGCGVVVVNDKRGVLKMIAYICGNIAVVGFCGFYLIEGGSLIKALVVLAAAVALTNLQIWYVFRLKPRD